MRTTLFALIVLLVSNGEQHPDVQHISAIRPVKSGTSPFTYKNGLALRHLVKINWGSNNCPKLIPFFRKGCGEVTTRPQASNREGWGEGTAPR